MHTKLRHKSSFGERKVGTTVPLVKCPKCRGEATCTHHGDTGRAGVDYEDLYTFKCSHCGHNDEKTVWVSGPYHGDGRSTCPFCGQ